MAVCLPKFAAEAFKQKLVDGTINPGTLSEMTSDERRAFFTDIVGEDNAKMVNANFESKLLLKDQQRGLIVWAKTLTGIKPEVQRDIIAKIERLGTALEPAELDNFLSDLVEQRLGVGVSAKEASEIATMARDIQTAKQAVADGTLDRREAGRAVVKLNNYVSSLKNEASKLSPKEYLTQNPLKTVVDIGGQAKSLKASLDDSAIFRQGWKTMLINPVIWQKNARQSFVDLVHQFGGKEVMDEVNADIISRPSYAAMKKAKLALGNMEEAFPSTLPEKIPVLGRAYKASEAAYTAFVQRTRADVFDQYLKIAQKSGVDITDKKELEAMGKIVNSLTGRGDLGKLEGGAEAVNNIFFSPRFLKSNIDLLTVHALDKGITPFARKKAAENLTKVVLGTAGALALAGNIAKAFGYDDAIEWDPRSSDFGKVKIGNTRFDFSGGVAPIVTLAVREITGKSKNTTSGAITDLTSGQFGMPTRMDTAVNFVEGKFGPLAGVVRDWMKGKDFNGNKPTIASTANNLFTPLPITNYMELAKDPNSANDLLAVMADALGIGTNDYAPPVKKAKN